MSQVAKELSDYLNNTLQNKLIESDTPTECKNGRCILGIDEAGRGPVLGPMSYAIAYYPLSKQDTLAKMKFADSKALSESTREELFESIQSRDGFQHIGYIIQIISPNHISNCMLRRKKFNLNLISHGTAIDLIQKVRDRGVTIEHVYIDTVGPPIKYKEKLQRRFPGMHFTVTEKADSKYPIVSAASVCAKVARDRIIHGWRYIESSSLMLDTYKLGSGYPADPDTKKYLENIVDPVFGFPTLARFSWSTITNAMKKNSCDCDWNEPDDDSVDQKDFGRQQQKFKKYFTKRQPAGPAKAVDRAAPVIAEPPRPTSLAHKFFNDRSLSSVISWDR